GRPVTPGEIGNLRVKGDSTMAYYWNKHEKTKEALYGPWIQTGDKYWQDADGYFWYAGRADDMLKVGGIWVSPVEVENTLVRHPAVPEAAVVGHEDGEGLVKPKAFVWLRRPGQRVLARGVGARRRRRGGRSEDVGRLPAAAVVAQGRRRRGSDRAPVIRHQPHLSSRALRARASDLRHDGRAAALARHAGLV